MKAWFKNFKLLATGRSAVSLPSMLLYLPISFIFALEREFLIAPNNFNNQLRIVLAGELTSFLFLHLSALTVLRNRRYREQNFFLCLAVWASTGVIRGISSEYYAASILDYPSYAASRILSSVLFSTLGLAFAAYSFGSIYASETKKSALRSLNGFILSENADLNLKHNVTKEDAIVTLQKSLVPKVIQLQNLTSGLRKVDKSAALQQPLQLLEEQAKQLAYQMRVNLDKLESIPNPRPGVTSRLQESSKNTLVMWPTRISINLSILFLSFGGVIVQIGRNSISGILSSLLGSTIIAAVVVYFEKLFRKIRGDLKQFVILITLLGVFATQYFYASQVVPLVFNLAQPQDALYSSAKVTFSVFLASSFVSYLDRDFSILQSMSEKSSSSRNVLNSKNDKIDSLVAVNTSTNQGALQGQISGVLLSLNLLTKDEDLNLTSANRAEIIDGANIVLGNAILEIKKLTI